MQRCTEGYRGAQMYVEVHGGVTKVHGGVYGGARTWTEGCVEMDRECTEVCRGLYRGIQRYVEVQKGLQRYVEVHERWRVWEGMRRYMGGVQMSDWRYGRCMEVYKGTWRCAEGHRDRQRCTEVHRIMCKCVWRSERCMELHVQVHEGGKWRCMKGWTKVYKGLYEGMQREIEAYFEVLYPFWVVDSLRTLKVHHYLSLVTIGCPLTHPAVYFCIPPCISVSPYTSLNTSS